MNYMSLQLKDSLNQLKGKGANHITHYLKNLGGKDGSMISGIEKMIDTINEENRALMIKVLDKMSATINRENRELIIKGVVAGSVIILISNATTWLCMKRKAKKRMS